MLLADASTYCVLWTALSWMSVHVGVRERMDFSLSILHFVNPNCSLASGVAQCISFIDHCLDVEVLAGVHIELRVC